MAEGQERIIGITNGDSSFAVDEETGLIREEMTPILENAELQDVSGEDDIPVSEISMPNDFMQTYPQIIPDSPRFSVPPNPLLPEKYSEILDYNALQYMNGIFRTQIGRYVKVQQLIGSTITQDYEGFLIGVGINYIILQEHSSKDIRILDIYGIKQMFVYYTAE